MINYDNLNRQHEAIMNEVTLIESEIRKGQGQINVAEAALHISKLAGLLKIHLLEEDKFLYPNLLNSADAELQRLTKDYILEMGHIAEEYTKFKTNYNVASKINKDKEGFLIAGNNMMREIKERMSKEDTELYSIARQKNL